MRLDNGSGGYRERFVRSFTDWLILSILRRKPAYGYEMISVIDEEFRVFWFSGIGFAETFAVLIYRPMRQMQEALSNLLQAIMILNSWVTQVGLILYGMDITKEDQRDVATRKITNLTSDYLRWLQEYLEPPRAKPSKEVVREHVGPPSA